jgi:hypothetical protein
MDVNFVHGPDRQPVLMGAEVGSPSVVPFHQVVSKGLLRAADERGLDPREWQELLLPIDRALEGAPVNRTSRLDAWTELGRAAGVLSFADSARCALEFVTAYGVSICEALARSDREGLPADACELWSIKEGHTASIWIVTMTCERWLSPIRYVLNVARDREAGIELAAMGSELASLGMRDSSVVGVLGSGTAGGDQEVVVIATTWIPGGCELHVLSDGRAVAIERFNADPVDPGRIASVVVRSDVTSDDLWSSILRSWIALGDWRRGDGPVSLPRTEINEGDWVFANYRAVLCALTPGPLELSPSEAVEACLSLSASMGYRGARVGWKNGEHALAIMHQAAASGSYPALTAALPRN